MAAPSKTNNQYSVADFGQKGAPKVQFTATTLAAGQRKVREARAANRKLMAEHTAGFPWVMRLIAVPKNPIATGNMIMACDCQ